MLKARTCITKDKHETKALESIKTHHELGLNIDQPKGIGRDLSESNQLT